MYIASEVLRHREPERTRYIIKEKIQYKQHYEFSEVENHDNEKAAKNIMKAYVYDYPDRVFVLFKVTTKPIGWEVTNGD